jgi:serine/threonine protein kinase
VIYLDGIYVDTYFSKGLKGLRLYHDSDYFRERTLHHKDQRTMDLWLKAAKQQAQFIDINQRYQRLHMLGKGKFSTVHLCKSQDNDENAAMKLIDKK